MNACIINTPSINETVFEILFNTLNKYESNINNYLNQHRGITVDVVSNNTNIIIMKAYCPVSECNELIKNIEDETDGYVFVNVNFFHWEKVYKMNDIIKEIRKEKNLKNDLPLIANYIDKL